MVRAFSDPNVVHVDGKVSPADDIETINTELILADLQTLEKALPRLEKEAKLRKDRAGIAAAAAAAAKLLDTGVTLYAGAEAAGIDAAELRELHLLTAQAVPVRLQRGRGGAGQRRVPRRAARRWSRRPRRSSWTPRSSRS